MKQKLIVLLIITAALVDFDAYSMQEKCSLAQMKSENKSVLNKSNIAPNAVIIARNIIDDVGLDKVAGDRNFYATSDRSQRAITGWCRENPATCEEMKIMLPYAFRYQVVKSIEEVEDKIERSYRNK